MGEFNWADPNIKVEGAGGATAQAAAPPPPSHPPSLFTQLLEKAGQNMKAGAQAGMKEYAGQVLDPTKYLPAIGHAMAHPLDTLYNASGIPAIKADYAALKGDMAGEKRPWPTAEQIGSGVGDLAAAGSQVATAMGGGPSAKSPVAAWLRDSAEQNYYDTLAPPAARDVPHAEKVAKGMAERRMTATSVKDLQNQAQAIKDKEGPAVEQAYTAPQPGIVPAAQAGAAGPPPMLQQSGKMEVFNDLEKLRNKVATIKRTGMVWEPGLNDYIDELKSRLTGMQDPATGEIPQEDLRNAKGILGQKQTAPGGRFKPGDELAPESKSAIDDALRVSIAKALHRANNVGETVDAQFNFGSDLHKFTEANRRAAKVANSKGGMAFGQNWLQSLTASKPLRIPREIIGFMDSVPWNTYSGATKMKVADAITKGNWGQVTRQLQLLKLGIPIDQEKDNGKTD